MFEESRDQWGLVVTSLGKDGDEFIIGNAACLWEAIHPFAYFNIDIAIFDKQVEVVVFHDGQWYIGDADAHVFIAFHICVEVEIFEIHAHEACIGCGDGAVEKYFGSC